MEISSWVGQYSGYSERSVCGSLITPGFDYLVSENLLSIKEIGCKKPMNNQ